MVNVRLRRGGPLLRAVLFGMFGLVIGMIGLVWTRHEITRLRYRLGELTHERAEVDAEVEKLLIEVAAASSPQRIEQRASRLGLRYPEPGQVIHVGTAPARPEVGAAATPEAVER
jgi:cell division protein FtsL